MLQFTDSPLSTVDSLPAGKGRSTEELSEETGSLQLAVGSRQ